jgi:HPt (histidine-containing phosphotransfer) domain-containing protein
MFLNKGFQAFIPKPIELRRLDAVIREWVRDKEMEKKMADEQIATEFQAEDTQKPQSGQSCKKKAIDWAAFDLDESGVDFIEGIGRFGGDEEAFLQVLRSYTINTPRIIEEIRDVTGETLKNYAIALHGIKGSSRAICAESIGTKAEALEKAAKAGNLDFVKANNGGFIKDLENFTGVLEKLFAKIDSENSRPKKDKPENDALLKLLAACKAYNMDGVDVAMEEIEQYQYESGGELAAWLRQNADMMNFAEMTEKLSALVTG